MAYSIFIFVFKINKMNRRQLIKNILGVSISTIFPIAMQKKELARNRTLHFVGLGGAGCNVVELAMQKYPNANYTLLNSKGSHKQEEWKLFLKMNLS